MTWVCPIWSPLGGRSLSHPCDSFTGCDIEARLDEERDLCVEKGVHFGQSSDVKEVPGGECQKVLWGCGSGEEVRWGGGGARQGQLWQVVH